MWLSRYWLMIPVLAIAGSLAAKRATAVTAGTLPTHTPLFVVMLVGVVLMVGALTFVPALALGPIVEHLQMMAEADRMNACTSARRRCVTRPIVMAAIAESFRKLDPRVQFRNPVMFVVFVGSILTTIIGLAAATGAAPDAGRPGFVLWVSAWLWLTVLFANFAEAVAEGRGKAQAATLRAMRRHVHARRLILRADGGYDRAAYNTVEAAALRLGDVVVVAAERDHPGRRRGHRGRRLGQRERGHGRVRAGAARGGRRLLVRDGRHARAVRLARRARHEPRGRGLPRPHDRDGRGREARPHAERDRALDPARHS